MEGKYFISCGQRSTKVFADLLVIVQVNKTLHLKGVNDTFLARCKLLL